MFMSTPTLKILYTNVNSYMPKKYLINNIIENLNINCALFVESKTKEGSNTKYRNWSSIQRNGNIVNNNARGGSLIQVHPSLKMGKANSPRVNNPLNEVTHFTIPFQNNLLHIFLVYIHPTSKIEENLFIMASRFKYAIIIGDFNFNAAKHKQINTFLSGTSFEMANTPPTFLMPNNIDSTPDALLYTKNISKNFNKIELIPDVGSDHLSIMFSFSLNLPADSSAPETNNLYLYNKCDMDKVNAEMCRHIRDNSVITPDTINLFNEKLKSSILKETPISEHKYFAHQLPPFIMRLIKQKRKIYQRLQAKSRPRSQK